MVSTTELFEQGYVLYKANQYEDALKIFDEILLLETNNLQALYGKSLVYNQMGHCLDALELLEFVIEQSGSKSDEMIAQRNYFIARVLQKHPELNHGKSFETAIEIRAESTPAGIRKEKQFIATVHGQYKFLQQTLQQHEDLGVFDVLSIETDQGERIDYYFNINDFFGVEFDSPEEQ